MTDVCYEIQNGSDTVKLDLITQLCLIRMFQEYGLDPKHWRTLTVEWYTSHAYKPVENMTKTERMYLTVLFKMFILEKKRDIIAEEFKAFEKMYSDTWISV